MCTERGRLGRLRSHPASASCPGRARPWLLLAAGLLAACLLAPGAARAQTAEPRELDLGLSYRVARSCPSASTFLEALRQHLGGGEGRIDTDVLVVQRPGRGDFELRLRLNVAGRQFEQVARASSCDTLVRLAALNAGIARTGVSADREGAELAAAPAAAAPDTERATLLPLAPLTPLAAPQLPPRTDARDAGAIAPRPQAEASPAQVFARLGVRAADGMLPELAWGEAAALGFARGIWSLRATGVWWGPVEEELRVDGSSPLELTVTQLSLELAPCLRQQLSEALQLEGCASFAAHRIHTSQAQTNVFGTLGGAALVSVRLWQGLRLELEGGLQAALAAPELRVARRVLVHQPALLQPIAQLALGWNFGEAKR